LSITYGLVQELGGKIRVTSELGKGTTFTITLPLVSRSKQMAAPPAPNDTAEETA
jgi:signal transduction histidine kinase